MNNSDAHPAEYPITYEFFYPDGTFQSFRVVLDKKTLLLVNPEAVSRPAWSTLSYKQCQCCPLNEADHPHCPVSVNIAMIIDTFKDQVSTNPCAVKCITPERVYLKENTSVQRALSSILGIIMPTSGCPALAFYRPMAFFHLPFATTEETLYRSVSLYLLQEYFEYRRGHAPDLEMKRLGELLKRVRMVNLGILARIRSIIRKDADPNAIIILDSFSLVLSMAVDDRLEPLAHLFPPK